MAEKSKKRVNGSQGKRNPKRIKLHPDFKSCGINLKYKSKLFQEELTNCWRDVCPFKDENTEAELLSFPFQCCCLPNFISDQNGNETDLNGGGTRIECNGDHDESSLKNGGFFKDLESELLQLKFYPKNNDLYQFHQSDDLKKFKSPCISLLRSLFHKECLPWLKSVTGIELSDTIDMTCSKYEYTDTLLCHDDELEGRRIAFILYLVPEWDTKDGGTLDLFDVDENGEPREVVRSISPLFNSMVFFDVTAKSFHQVSEILSVRKTRLSINGWFHGPPSPRPSPKETCPLPLAPPVSMGLEVLSEWIDPMYLDVGVQSQIQQQFETDSQIELPNFLLEEQYKLLCEEITTGTKWIIQGPANRKHVHISDPTSLQPLTQSFINLLHSKPFCLLLAHLTELELADNIIKVDQKELKEIESKDSNSTLGEEQSSSLELKSSALCRGELFHWCPGDYTLAGDPTDPGLGRFCLEATLCFNSEEWSEENGGTVSYIADNADEEFLTVCPSSNCLSLVYRDKDLLRFTKYLNHRSKSLPNESFYTASMTYIENSEDSNDE